MVPAALTGRGAQFRIHLGTSIVIVLSFSRLLSVWIYIYMWRARERVNRRVSEIVGSKLQFLSSKPVLGSLVCQDIPEGTRPGQEPLPLKNSAYNPTFVWGNLHKAKHGHHKYGIRPFTRDYSKSTLPWRAVVLYEPLWMTLYYSIILKPSTLKRKTSRGIPQKPKRAHKSTFFGVLMKSHEETRLLLP